MTIIPAGILLHIPDGFLNFFVALVAWLLAGVMLAIAVANTRRDFDERLVPLAGIMAAFIFAAQMLNFPVAGGTSGHFIGAALAFIVLGPWLGMLVMTAVIAVQALLFQDGGLVVMGANILVMGVVPGFVAYYIYRLGSGRSWGTRMTLAGAAAWFSVMAAALVVSLLLAFSGTSNLEVVLPVMLGVHALIGLGEALITVAALVFIRQVRPALLEGGQGAGRGGWVVAGLAIALLLVLLAPFASGHPDGLEWVAETTGFLETAQDAPYQLLPDYTVPFLGETSLSTIVAGVIGALVVAGLVYLAARYLRRSKPQRSQQTSEV
jgi:cobalt/nickel transport system permease protein